MAAIEWHHHETKQRYRDFSEWPTTFHPTAPTKHHRPASCITPHPVRRALCVGPNIGRSIPKGETANRYSTSAINTTKLPNQCRSMLTQERNLGTVLFIQTAKERCNQSPIHQIVSTLPSSVTLKWKRSG